MWLYSFFNFIKFDVSVAFKVHNENDRKSGCIGHRTDVALNCIGSQSRSKRSAEQDPFRSFMDTLEVLGQNDSYANLADQVDAKLTTLK